MIIGITVVLITGFIALASVMVALGIWWLAWSGALFMVCRDCELALMHWSQHACRRLLIAVIGAAALATVLLVIAWLTGQ